MTEGTLEESVRAASSADESARGSMMGLMTLEEVVWWRPLFAQRNSSKPAARPARACACVSRGVREENGTKSRRGVVGHAHSRGRSEKKKCARAARRANVARACLLDFEARVGLPPTTVSMKDFRVAVRHRVCRR